MKIIADTNTFIAVALNEPEKESIIGITKGFHLAAPEILPFEIGNALTAMLKKNILMKEEMNTAWKAAQTIPVELRKIEMEDALDIAGEHHIYAYDAYFLECAKRLRCPILTLDRRMKRIAKTIGITTLEYEK